MTRSLSIGVCALAFLAGCSSNNSPTCPVPTGGASIAIIATDYTSGMVSAASGDTALHVYTNLQAIHSDAVARAHGGLLYVINRLGADNVQVLDPRICFHTDLQFSVGRGTNPHDIAFVSSDRAYVSRNSSLYLLEVDPQTGAKRDSISLAMFADPDGNPDMDRLFFRDPYLYVSLDRINYGGPGYPPVPPSYIAVIDTRTNTVVDVDPNTAGIQAIALQGLNPSAPMVWDEAEGVLLVPEFGIYRQGNGAIEKVDLLQWRSVGFLVGSEALQGNLTDFVLTPGGRGFATVAGVDNSTSLISFDATTGERTGVLLHSAQYTIADLLYVPSTGHLLVCDRQYDASGLRVYDAATGRAVAGFPLPIPTGLPPLELLLLE